MYTFDKLVTYKTDRGYYDKKLIINRYFTAFYELMIVTYFIKPIVYYVFAALYVIKM